MELWEVLKKYKGKKVKIGCNHGSGFLFIGEVKDNTDTVMKKLSIGYDDRMAARLQLMRNRLNDYGSMIRYRLNIYDGNYKDTVKRYNEELVKLRKRLEGLRMHYDEKYVEVRKCIAEISRKNKKLEALKRDYKTNRDILISRLESDQRNLESNIYDLNDHLFDFHNFSECKVVEDRKSIDSEFGGRILLIDAWDNGKFWLEDEAVHDNNFQRLVDTCY